jgi:hypothetical protein
MNGTLPSGEVFSTGIHAQSALDIAEVSATWVSAITALWTGTGSAGINDLYTPETILTTSVVTELDPLTDKAVDQIETALSIPGGATGTPLPQEVAVVITTRTAQPGPSGRGRLFMPPPASSTVSQEGRLTSGNQLTYVGGFTVMFQAMASATHDPILHSKGRADRLITRFDVGDVFDAMRSRRDKLIESRTTSAPIVRAA